MSDIAERIGIYSVSRISARLPGLIFREQRSGDTGLNAHLEITEEYPRTGKAIGLQIRSSDEERFERTARGYVCRGEMTHMAYWLQHSLPVLIMLHDSRSNSVLWQIADAETIEIINQSWELLIPHDNVYGPEAVPVISALPCYSPYLARLALDSPWMSLIENGHGVFLEMEEWINQPSERGSLRLCVEKAGEGLESVYEWAFNTDPDMPHIFRLPALFPWAKLSIDENFYREKGVIPQEGSLAPWVVEAGEIARFQIRLSLNDLGNAFLVHDRFIRRGVFPTPPVTSIPNPDYEKGIKLRLYEKY